MESPETGSPDRFVFDAPDVVPLRRWLAAGALGLTVESGPDVEIHETLLDTASWRFRRAGLGLRIERGAAGLEAVTEPLGIGGAGALEAARAPLEADRADLLAACAGAVGRRVRDLAGHEPPAAICELTTRREPFRLIRAGRLLATLLLDETIVPSPDRRPASRFFRVEVTAAATPGGAPEGWLSALCAVCSLRPALATRQDAALRAVERLPPEPPALGPLAIDPRGPSRDAALAVLREQLLNVLAHEPGTRLGEDAEELHQMRVATRRMRAAIRLFEAWLPVAVVRLRGELSWLGGALGEARDLDVQLDQLAVWRERLAPSDHASLAAAAQLVGERRAAARRRMLRALDSRRYARFVERSRRALSRPPAARRRTDIPPVGVVAPLLIRARRARALMLGDPIGAGTGPETYHRLRIRCKALRYALEFLHGVYGDALDRPLNRLVKLQDLLGEHQDAEIALRRLRETARRRGLPPATVFVLGELSERYRQRAEALRAKFPAIYRKLRGGPWKKLDRLLDRHAVAHLEVAAVPRAAERPGVRRVVRAPRGPEARPESG